MLLPLLAFAAVSQAPRQLYQFLGKPDPSFDFRQETKGLETDIDMTSQTWMGTPWKHKIIYRLPRKVSHDGIAILYITGDGPKLADYQDLGLIAAATDVPVAVMFNVPNQPLFGGLKEDDLIAYSFEKFLETGDENWPALFPMTLSAIKAMDAIQIATRNTDNPIQKFIVAGGSKRGWTTWMVGASGDPRVAGIAPLVFDNLNIPAQMKHQIDSWGKYSEQIEEYTRRGLQQKLETTARGRLLGQIVDPYSYRDRIKVPTLIVNGANDRYWTVDALSLYWNGLPMPHWASLVTNSGHDLGSKVQTIEAVGAFARALSGEFDMPSLAWTLTQKASTQASEKLMQLSLKTGRLRARGLEVWAVESDNLDFRPHIWKKIAEAKGNGPIVFRVSKELNTAYLAQAKFVVNRRGFVLSRPATIIKKE